VEHWSIGALERWRILGSGGPLGRWRSIGSVGGFWERWSAGVLVERWRVSGALERWRFSGGLEDGWRVGVLGRWRRTGAFLERWGVGPLVKRWSVVWVRCRWCSRRGTYTGFLTSIPHQFPRRFSHRLLTDNSDGLCSVSVVCPQFERWDIGGVLEHWRVEELVERWSVGGALERWWSVRALGKSRRPEKARIC
jgi:hypothetical protein